MLLENGYRYPKGVPGDVFDGIKQTVLADRYAWFGPHNIGWTHSEETNAALMNFLKAEQLSLESR